MVPPYQISYWYGSHPTCHTASSATGLGNGCMRDCGEFSATVHMVKPSGLRSIFFDLDLCQSGAGGILLQVLQAEERTGLAEVLSRNLASELS